MPLIRIRDVMRGFSETYTSEEYEEEYIITEGELLIGMDGEFNISRWGKDAALLNQRVCHLIPRKIDKSYLFYFMPSALKKIEQKTPFVTVKHLSAKELSKIEVPIPPLKEQIKMAAVLDKVSLLIVKQKEQLNDLDILVKSQFIEMFGELDKNTKQLPVRKLSEISSYWNGLTYKPADAVEEGTGTLVLRSSNIQSGALAFDDNVYVNCTIKEKLFVQDNDILMCSRNGSAALVGKTALIKNLKKPTTFGAFMMIIRSEYYSYLKTYFEMPYFRSQISTGTSTINQITGKMLNEILLPVPDMDTVRKFEAFVNQSDKSKLAAQKGLQELEILKKSLMQQYFG